MVLKETAWLDDSREVCDTFFRKSPVQCLGALHRVFVQDFGLGSKNDKDVLFRSSLNFSFRLQRSDLTVPDYGTILILMR